MSTAVRAGGLTFLFALTLFTSASLVFIVEPMFGKMALALPVAIPPLWTPPVDRSPIPSLLMARAERDLGSLASDPRWTTLEPDPGTRIWSDDFSDVFSVLKL